MYAPVLGRWIAGIDTFGAHGNGGYVGQVVRAEGGRVEVEGEWGGGLSAYLNWFQGTGKHAESARVSMSSDLHGLDISVIRYGLCLSQT